MHQALQRGEVSPVEAARHYLDRIEAGGARVGAFATVTPELALERAAFVEREVPRARPLWGMPLADKDLEQRAGVPTAFGSRAFAGYVPETSDDLVVDLDRAGAVSLGKSAAPEFGMPAYTETLVGPPARNPWDLALGAGGSSGGAAAAVAAGLLPFAPGSDGGGSIRIPAASCGLVGIKPSRGRVPGGSGQAGPGGLAVAGALARTVADAALLLDGMIAPVGYPAEAHWALRAAGEEGPFLGEALRGQGRFQLGVSTDSPWKSAVEIDLHPDQRRALDVAIEAFDWIGHGLEDVPDVDEPDYPAMFSRVWQGTASAIPVEGDGVAALEPLTRWLLAEGRAMPARALAEALSWFAAYERRTIARFAAYDAVLTPALATLPPAVGSWSDDGPENFAQQCRFTPYTSFVNVAGLPAITVPVAETAAGLPLGVQLIGRPGGEGTLFALAAQLERSAKRTAKHPPVW
nr:amidase [Agromyces seonyuensis]